MNALLPIAAIGTLLFLSSSKSKPAIKTIKPYFSDDCQWYCDPQNITKGISFSKILRENKKFYDKHINTYVNDSDFGIQSLTKELMKSWNWNKCKLNSEISINDSLTMRYVYTGTLPTSAIYLALSEKITDYQLAMWLGIEYPKILSTLGLLVPGDYKLDVLQPTFDVVNSSLLQSELNKVYKLIPEARNIQAELMATILMIGLSQTAEVVTKGDCYKITKAQYGDFSSLGGKIDPSYQILFNKIFDAVVLANPK